MAEQGENASAVAEAVGELVVSVPPPRGDHRQHQSSTLAEEILIDPQVVPAYVLGHVRHIKLNGATAAGFEVDEARPTGGVEDVPRMRLTVQYLLNRAAAFEPLAGTVQRVEQKFTPCGAEGRCSITVRHQALRFLDPVGDV